MPGASLMTLVSGPSIALVISVSEPARTISARPLAEPDAPPIAVAKPAEIDSTETNTTTTPAIPIMATAEEPKRLGIVRRLTSITAIVCLSQFTRFLLISPQSFCNPQPHRAHRRHDSRQKAHQQHQSDTSHNILWRQYKDRKQTARRIAALHDCPRDRKPKTSTRQRDKQRLGKNEREDAAVREPERL